jgi:hypothetical protein
MLIERLAQMYVHWGSPAQTGDLGRRKKDQAVSAVRQFLDVIESTTEDRKTLFTQSQQSRRKATKLAYLLLASETEPEAIYGAFLRSGLLSSAGQRSNKPEVLLWLAGTEAIARGMHPYIAFLIMSSYFGLETAEEELRWLQERAKASSSTLEEYIVPGDLTDSIEEALKEPARLQRTIRIAGMPLSASAFAGCSVYYIEKILALVGPIGATMLSQMILSARKRLVSDEISTAQQAFVDLFTQEEPESRIQEEEAGVGQEAFEEPNLPDPELMHTTTNIVMEAEAKILKSTLSSMSDGEIASLLRCLEAIAHERLLNLISQGRQKRVLAVIQKTEDVASGQMLRDAQLFAQKLLAAYAPKNLKPGTTLSIPEKLRGLISYLLSRE